MGSWRHRYITEKDGWQGSCIFPRHLSLSDNKLVQRPVSQLDQYRADAVELENITIDGRLKVKNVDSSPCEINLILGVNNGGDVSVEMFKEAEACTTLRYDGKTKTLGLYSEQNARLNLYGADVNNYVRKCKVETVNGLLELRILIDKSSVEVFVNGGVDVMSMLVYPADERTGVEFVSDSNAKIVRLTCYKVHL